MDGFVFKPRTVRVLVALATCAMLTTVPVSLCLGGGEPGAWFHFLWIIMHTSDCWNVGVGFSARIKAAYSVPTKTKRLSYRGLEKGVTREEGKNLDPSDETNRSANTHTYIYFIVNIAPATRLVWTLQTMIIVVISHYSVCGTLKFFIWLSDKYHPGSEQQSDKKKTHKEEAAAIIQSINIFSNEIGQCKGNLPQQFSAHDLFALEHRVCKHIRDRGEKQTSSQKTPVFLWWKVFPWRRRGLDWALLMTGEEAVLICKPVGSI